MNIAEVSNVIESVPPKKYGGTEYVISVVTEGLVAKNHSVNLFATGDSVTTSNLIAVQETSLRAPETRALAEMMLARQLINLQQRASGFDIIHNHILQTFALLPFTKTPIVTTLHTNLSAPPEKLLMSLPDIKKTYFISISDSQRKHAPDLNYLKTIYHGLAAEEYPFNAQPEDYLLFLGRITPEKGVEYAVEVAKKTNLKLVIAAKVDEPKSDYAKQMLKLFEETPGVNFIGEVGQEKKELLKNAKALLMPIQWDEPFGLVVIEALACGTPVIAFNKGAMSEIILDKETGFLVKDATEMAQAVSALNTISRERCRKLIEDKFTIEKMVDQYEKVFLELLDQRKKS